VRADREEAVECEAADLESLLVRFLNELIYRMSAPPNGLRRLHGLRYRGDGGWRVAAVARGEPLDLERHEPTVEPKGATFMAARVAKEPNGTWISQCVVDV
jgi:tRNA nucleotidyltransferase (CCA-adding enzyme)